MIKRFGSLPRWLTAGVWLLGMNLPAANVATAAPSGSAYIAAVVAGVSIDTVSLQAEADAKQRLTLPRPRCESVTTESLQVGARVLLLNTIPRTIFLDTPRGWESLTADPAPEGHRCEPHLATADGRHPPRLADPFTTVANESRIARNVLKSVSLRESGRAGVAHPWTLNVHGQGLYYATREDAYRALIAYRQAGYTSIDVGPMQINLRYHGHRFTDLWSALDPTTNVRVAADILRELYRESGDLHVAVARYHSRNPERGRHYLQGVLRQYQQLSHRTSSSQKNGAHP
jgi:hypothetical protein